MSMQDEDAGAIDTSDDNSGAPPVMGTPSVPAEDDSTGVNDQAQSQGPVTQSPQGSPQESLGNAAPQGPLASVGKRIISYLMGADAAHPQTIDQVGQQIDPEGKLPPADRNLLALDRVRETKGDNAAWQLLQANRVAYNAQSAFAKTAMEGTPQKPADMRAAIDAANKAQANVLDGSNIQFAPGQGGITATVSLPGSRETQQIALSPQAFAAFLDVGGDGQWDKVMEHSAPATLQRLAKQFPAQAQAPGQMPARNPRGADIASQAARPAAPAPQRPQTTFGKTPSTMNLSGSEDRGRDPGPANDGIDDEVRNRANQLYPNISQGAERNKYISDELSRQETNENKVDVAREQGTWRNTVAQTTGGAKVEASKNYSEARLAQARERTKAAIAHEEAVNGRSDKTQQMRGLVSKVATGQALAPGEQQVWDRIVQNTPEPGRQQAQPAAQRQAAPQHSAQDQQAIAWAKANPNDPRSAKIMQKLGVQ